jgi:hypothetical protein
MKQILLLAALFMTFSLITNLGNGELYYNETSGMTYYKYNNTNSGTEITTTSDKSTDTIEIRGILKEGDYVSSNLYFQNSTISFGRGSDICQDQNCAEFQDTTFDKFGQDRVLSGMLKVKNVTKSDVNFTAFDYYKLSGTFGLSSSKENLKTGQKILVYEGSLGIDKEDPTYRPEFEYKSKAQLSGNSFELNGTNIRKFFGS